LALSHQESNILAPGVLFFSKINLLKFFWLSIEVKRPDAQAHIIIKS
jgi:hypothetical protein